MAEKLNELVADLLDGESTVTVCSIKRFLEDVPEGAFVHELLAALEPREVVG